MTDTKLRALLSGTAALLLLAPGAAFAQSYVERPNAIPFADVQANPFGDNPLDTDPSKDEIVLDVDDDISHEEIVALGRACAVDLDLNSEHSDPANLYVADVAEGEVASVADCFQKQAPAGWIEAMEENVEYTLLGAPNDPLYQFQWHFKQVNAEAAWKVTSGKGVVVSVIDTGVAVKDDAKRNIKRARDLAGTDTVPGYDFVDKDPFAWDGHGHGTHVAGTIAQTTNNKFGVAGLAHGAKIMPLRVLNSRGFGQVADIADAIRFSADNGAQVINMSLGGPLPSLVMKQSIEYAYKKGVTTVAAAGNGGKRAPSYPAAYDHVIAVAATQFDRHTTFYSQWGKYVDIAAPGGNTRVDQNGDGRMDGVLQETLKDGKTDQHDFLLFMGTSMASPHVAAAAALVVAQGVTHPDKVEAVLQKTASDSEKKRYSNPSEYKERYGAGIMQADAAVKNAVATQGGFRLGAAGLLALLAFGRVRRKDPLGFSPSATPLFVGAAVMGSAGLFFLPLLFGDAGMLGNIASTLGRPFPEWDSVLLGFEVHQNPILASAAIPLAAVASLHGHKRWRYLAAGLAIGFAGFCLTEAVLLTSDVRWVPGIDVLDRIWLAANGVVSLVLGYLSLKR